MLAGVGVVGGSVGVSRARVVLRVVGRTVTRRRTRTTVVVVTAAAPMPPLVVVTVVPPLVVITAVPPLIVAAIIPPVPSSIPRLSTTVVPLPLPTPLSFSPLIVSVMSPLPSVRSPWSIVRTDLPRTRAGRAGVGLFALFPILGCQLLPRDRLHPVDSARRPPLLPRSDNVDPARLDDNGGRTYERSGGKRREWARRGRVLR